MKKFLIILLICLCVGQFANAELITIAIEANVTGVSDYHSLLEGKVSVGSKINGTYVYNTNTPDTNPASEFGEYIYHCPPYGVSLMIGGLTFMSDVNHTDFGIGITNDSQGDWYGFISRNNMPLANFTEVESISLTSCDYEATAISDTILPTTAPVLSDWDYNTLIINGGIGGTPPCYEKWFSIRAEVTSAVLIPEPVSVLLFGFGLLVLRKKH